MSNTIYTVIESRTHPVLTDLYAQCGLEESGFRSMRKVIAKIKSDPPDFIAVEFFYGYGNNYAGINSSNVDVMLYSLQRYAKHTKVIVFVDKSERQYVDKLNDIIPLHAVFTHPVDKNALKKALKL